MKGASESGTDGERGRERRKDGRMQKIGRFSKKRGRGGEEDVGSVDKERTSKIKVERVTNDTFMIGALIVITKNNN